MLTIQVRTMTFLQIVLEFEALKHASAQRLRKGLYVSVGLSSSCRIVQILLYRLVGIVESVIAFANACGIHDHYDAFGCGQEARLR